MRIAAMILGLVLTVGLFVQSVLVAAGDSLDDALNDRANESENGSVGILVAFVYLVASALVIAKPRFSMWAFGVGAVIAAVGGATTAFVDLWFWAVVGGVLAVMAWRGSVEKRANDVEERAGREAIQQLAVRHAAQSSAGEATDPGS